MSKNSDFHSVDFFRSVRDKHANLLSDMATDEIIAFFENQDEPNNSATSATGWRVGAPAREGGQVSHCSIPMNEK